VKNICLYHHERIDGKGYEGKTDLPMYLQIISLCDVYDALTTDRIYRQALSHERALSMIQNGDCGTFAPEIVKYLKEIEE
jgi:putative two-component system response regulator